MADLNDPARLAALHHVMLRAEADALLDACVTRAAELARAPMALVSLVIRHIQLFRAHRGLPPELAVSCATSRSHSFCQLVILGEAPLLVEDAERDERVPKELVHHYGIRAYAGVPIRVNGHVVGSFCVLDHEPRRFEPQVVEALQQLAAEAAGRLVALAGHAAPARRALHGRLGQLAQTARLLEHALLAIAPAIADAQRATATLAEAPRGAPAEALPGAPSPDDLRAAIACYRDMFAIAEELTDDALAIALSSPAGAGHEIAAEACSLARDLVEIRPLVHLAEGVLQGTLGDAAAVRAAVMVRDAFAAHETALAAARRIVATAGRAQAAMASRAPGGAAEEAS